MHPRPCQERVSKAARGRSETADPWGHETVKPVRRDTDPMTTRNARTRALRPPAARPSLPPPAHTQDHPSHPQPCPRPDRPDAPDAHPWRHKSYPSQGLRFRLAGGVRTIGDTIPRVITRSDCDTVSLAKPSLVTSAKSRKSSRAPDPAVAPSPVSPVALRRPPPALSPRGRRARQPGHATARTGGVGCGLGRARVAEP